MNQSALLQTYHTDDTATDFFVLASTSEINVRWIVETIGASATVEVVALDASRVTQRIAESRPTLLFVDFSEGRGVAASAVTSAARAAFPGLQVIALGRLSEPQCALAALRSGACEFVDVAGDAGDALRIVREVLGSRAQPPSRHGRLTVLLGARIGVGVTTLAANLGVLFANDGRAHGRHTALLDLGLPAGEGAVLLSAGDDFSFVDAVRNLHRVDETFVHTAFAHHTSGLALITLPTELGALREISSQSAVALLTRLRAFFDHQIVDLGGFTNTDFIAQVAQAADNVWMICDQSVASIVSAARQLEVLRDVGVDSANMRLVLNRYEAELDLTAANVATQLGIELTAVLPARHVALCQAANRGELVVNAAPRDPYVRALEALRAQLDSVQPHSPKKREAFWRFLSNSLKRS
ncbi:fimbrial protein [Paraburkholderia lycopersici]|uniref:Pilus assembly protein CpaE n=1 Tax=Paraburkholderia lycopersici TaxID=416944 RepID=A0A1G7BFA9_9BURK|nr:fimbrial protein [Paraburkholderia lycopersici]SDE25739.1 pilus assembly protein CpaE [Paraburkholderia lycopersici]